MVKLLRHFIVLTGIALALFSSQPTFAQTPGSSTLNIRLTETIGYPGDGNGGPEYVYRLFLNGGQRQCFTGGAMGQWLTHNSMIGSSSITNGNLQDFSLLFEAFEEDGQSGNDDTCLPDSNDDAVIRNIDFDISPADLNIRPGITQEVYLIIFNGNNGLGSRLITSRADTDQFLSDQLSQGDHLYAIELSLDYAVPVPEDVTAINMDLLCANEDITLVTDIQGIPANSSNVTLEWEYNVSGDNEPIPCNEDCNPSSYCNGQLCILPNGDSGCQTTTSGGFMLTNDCQPITLPSCCTNPGSQARYRTLGTTNFVTDGTTFSFTPDDFTLIRNAVGGSRTNINFRVTARDGRNNIVGSASALSVQPAAPTINTTTITSDPSCSNFDNGQVTFNVNGRSNFYRWTLRTAPVANCTLDEILSGNCLASNIEAQGFANNGLVTHSGLAPGTYYLTVQNWDQSVNTNNGRCFTTYNDDGPIYTILEIPALQFNGVTSDQVSCFGGTDGRIVASSLDGDANTLMYDIISGPIDVDAQPTGTFENLPAGDYVVEISDQCITRTMSIEVGGPDEPVSASTEKTDPLCTSEGDGEITIIPSGGYGTYDIELFKNGVSYATVSLSDTDRETIFTNLGHGNYTYTVMDGEHLDCIPATGAIDLPLPPALSLSVKEVIPVTCFKPGDSDGQVSFSVDNAAFDIQITMENINTNEVFSAADSTVTGLSEGNYTVTLSYLNGVCSDIYVHSQTVEITKPEPIVINTTSRDITCQDDFDGMIEATVQGGNDGPYELSWETQIGGTWVPFNDASRQNGLRLFNLFDGDYRLLVEDVKGCEQISDTITIVNPPELIIEDVILSGLACKEEENGRIIPQVTGGWGGYVYEFRQLPDTTWTVFNTNEPFSQGSYEIRVTDQLGCIKIFGDSLFFAEADEALLISGLDQTLHNGFDLTCYDANDGQIIINATGGLVTSAEGYQYRVDDRPYQFEQQIDSLDAGEHVFYVLDNNGCERSDTLTLNQPELLKIAIDELISVRCFGDSSGLINVRSTGGVPGYSFSLNSQDFVIDNIFDSLSSGDFNITVEDQNGCLMAVDTTIVDLFQQVENEWLVQDVSCFAYADGSVTAVLQGGEAPYITKWDHLPEPSGPTLNRLTTGWYSLKITDNQGCISRDSIFIDQPTGVEVGDSINLCHDQTGILDATFDNPNATYEWFSPNGFASASPLVEIGEAGTYHVTVDLLDGCVMHDSITFHAFDSVFNARFISVSEILLGDTVQLVEVSDPNPDSLIWRFDPAAIVLDSSQIAPQLYFDEAGEYEINFTAHYGPCTDSVTKVVTVFLEEEAPESIDFLIFGETGFNNISAFPNPSDGRFTLTVELNQPEELAIAVVSLDGDEVFNQNYSAADSYEIDFDMRSNPPGIYLIRLVTARDQRTLRVFIN